MARARTKNPRGSGERLRAELLAAANAVLDATGDPAAVTIRGVASAVGVAPNAVYLHFADRAALLDALVADRFRAFGSYLRAAIDEAGDDAVERLRRGHAAYCAYALEHPGHYRLLFGGNSGPEAAGPGMAAFELCIESCRGVVESGAVGDVDPRRLALSIWAFQHGYVELRLAPTSMPMPTPLEALDALLAAMRR